MSEHIIIETVFYFFCSMVLFQILYSILIHSRLAWFSKANKYKNNDFKEVPVSIIIAARNESDNLFKNLPIILDQAYSEFEVIVVNNQSLDDSSWLLMAFCRQYKNLRVIEVKKNRHLRPGKKFPVSIGIKGAKYEHLLLIDADCKPNSKFWIKEMVGCMIQKNQVVLGYGPHIRTKQWWNKLFRFDTAWIAMNYFSFSLFGLPYMGVGRNLAYTKSAFNSVQGFKSHYSIISGDDDLFIQDVSKTSKISIQISENSHCYSPSAENLRNWIRQKKRHHSTSKKYNLFKKSLLGIYPLSLILVVVSFVYLCLVGYKTLVLVTILTGMITIKWIIQGKCLLKLKERSFIPYLPLWDLIYSLTIPFIYLFTIRKELNRW